MNVEQATRLLHDDLAAAIAASQQRTTDLRAFWAQLEKLPQGNAPTQACKQLLNHFGFCVLTRDELHAIAVVVNLHLAREDFESADEKQRLEELFANVESEAANAIRR